jgi:4-amino-4-deoxy-L-arabinose transferase-like glycosyltransferase
MLPAKLRSPGAGALVLLWAILVAINIQWLERHILAFPPPWDPAFYLWVSLRLHHALSDAGVAALYSEFVQRSPYAPPFLPLTSVPLYMLFGDSRLVAHLTTSLYLLLLLAGIYDLAARRHGHTAGFVAALLTASFSAVVNLSRDYLMDFPFVTLLTLAVAALSRSEGFRRRGASLAFGGLLGVALLTRMMAGVFFVGPVLWALFAHRGEEQRARWTNLALAGSVAGLVASVWWAPNLRGSLWYLFHFGFGAGAAPYNPTGGGFLSLKDVTYYALAIVNMGVSLPLALGLGALGLHQLFSRPAEETRSGTPKAEGYLWSWFLFAYAALTLSRNKAPDRYTLVLLPPLAVWAAGRLVSLQPARWRRIGLAAAVFAGAVNFVSLTWETGLPLQWRYVPPFAIRAYTPPQAWLRSTAFLSAEWPSASVLRELAGIRAGALNGIYAWAARQQDSAPASIEDVQRAYRALLKREPDETGLLAYESDIASGSLTRTQLAQSMAQSDEARSRPLHVLAAPQHLLFNVNTLRYAAEMERLPLLISPLPDTPIRLVDLEAYDVILVKDGTQAGAEGPAAGAANLSALLAEKDSPFAAVAGFPGPDGSMIRIFTTR